MKLDGLTICVTGGMGFVGSHAAKTLKSAGAKVILLDRRLQPGPAQYCDDYIVADYANVDALDELEHIGVDGFIHCAATSLVGPSMSNPGEYYFNNVTKTIMMLEHLRNWQEIPFVVFSSSAAVYGNPGLDVIPECAGMNPMNPYGQTKAMIEQILSDYSNAYGLRSISLRYFNACGADQWGSDLGPEEGDTHIIPKIFEAYQSSKPFTIFGNDYKTHDNTCVRDYIHVSDLAIAHAKAIDALATGHKGGSYNLGTNIGYSNLELVGAFNEYVDQLPVVFGARREGDPDWLVADATAFKEEFNWAPAYSDLPNVITSTKKFYDKHR